MLLPRPSNAILQNDAISSPLVLKIDGRHAVFYVHIHLSIFVFLPHSGTLSFHLSAIASDFVFVCEYCHNLKQFLFLV